MNEEKYQGLNLPQLFERLHDIVSPEAVSWLPQTPGWWVLLAWVVAVTSMCTWKAVQGYRRNRYRREAIKLIDTIDPAAEGAATAIAGIVKRTALAVYDRKDVASLYGEEWASFLVRSAGGDSQLSRSATLLARAAYRPETNAQDVIGPAKRWIRVHRA